MRLARTLAISFAALTFSTVALAQQRGGPQPLYGFQPGGPAHGRGGPGGRPVLVAPDGSAVYVKTTTTTSDSTTTTTQQLVDISTTGAVAWTWTPPAAIHDIVFPTGLVAMTAVPRPTSSTSTVTSQVIALNLSTGAQAWTASFDGVVSDLEVSTIGLLCTVSKYTAPSGSSRQGTVSRSLVALSLTGNTLWTYSLD